MPTQYKTPGVYVGEKDAFGSNIVANAATVPVFIGFTEKAGFPNGEALPELKLPGQNPPAKVKTKAPYLINSMLDYTQCFGGPDTTGTIEVNEIGQSPNQHYVAEIINGIDPQGKGIPYEPSYTQPAVVNYFTNGGGSCYILSLGSFEEFNKNDTGAVNLDIIFKAIKEAEQCTLIMPIDLIRYHTSEYYNWANQFLDYAFESKAHFCVLDVIMNDPKNSILDQDDVNKYKAGVTSNYLKYAAAYYPYLKSLTPYVYEEDKVIFNDKPLSDADNAKAESIRSFLATNYINMPPSPFIAGIYCRLDNATGVWTSPSNVALTGISGPVVDLTSKQWENFAVDAVTGKSINAIRNFIGKGNLIWGARTNDGNSLHWKYVNVVRLFISIETDISRALDAFVFKPNVNNTWVEVKTMIDSYLFGLYSAGAFKGFSQETSYRVEIGLQETMTNEDVLNGYMRITVFIAPSKPAEFIVLTFSQIVGQ